ncbi:uncharacterized protein LOC110854036 isoform X3 [Folsomia candida]|uniref:uncharacterized protein LOC110854036 isoform X3 n=1 Tax=Folsomia candida TaxID=158441 RepID=UPI001604D04A|nr:uncharacterized protein LOC110854036 isoform X3 [Folsomia candida]
MAKLIGGETTPGDIFHPPCPSGYSTHSSEYNPRHHRPRIKLKSKLTLSDHSEVKSAPSFVENSRKLLTPRFSKNLLPRRSRFLPPPCLRTVMLVTFIFVVLNSNLTVSAATDADIEYNNNPNPLTSSSSLSTSPSLSDKPTLITSDFSSSSTRVKSSSEKIAITHQQSFYNSANKNDASNWGGDIRGGGGDDNSDKQKGPHISHNNRHDKKQSSSSSEHYSSSSLSSSSVNSQKNEVVVNLNFHRPLQHFSDSPEKSSASTTPEVIEDHYNELMQADEASTQQADNNPKGSLSEKKITKSSRKKAATQTVIVPILEFNATSPHRISGAYQSILNYNKTRNEIIGVYPNGTGGLGVIIKPRRLESLSYGLKSTPSASSTSSRASAAASSSSSSNSIPFDEEDEENSGSNSNIKKKANKDLEEVDETKSQHVHKTSLQIRRDLSRLVASVGAGIDDDSAAMSKCDHVYISSQNGPKNGTFESPILPIEEGNLITYTCMLMFVARPSERVDINFEEFNVRGTPPECIHEWVDIWTEVEGTDLTDLITTPFSGRYCGKIPPRKRISLYGGIAIGFYSDKNSTDEPIFQGTYSFINESRYVVGTPVPRTLCSYTILASSNKGIGELLSPTYPGVYPKNLSCSYKFIGSPGQRVRIEFRDFDVFYGGQHCPFDDVKVYDGADPTSPLIGTYCGQQRNLVIYSSEHMMLVTFTTLDRNTDSQNRGFSAVYEFSNSFVKLDFIEKNMGDHIRGTECDQRILSKGQSSGVVYSPNYPFPYLPKIVCRYFVYGLQDQQNLERVRLSFEIFDVPSQSNSAEDEVNQSDVKRCGDGFLKVYLKGQEVIQAYDKADYEFCGKELPHSVVSDGPRMVLVFSSGETQGSGFKGRFSFETEYRVPGTEEPGVPCHFTYYSTSRMKGEFNSPRFPSNYPSKTNCMYLFHMEHPKEQVRIVFDGFKLRADKFVLTDRGAYGSNCDEDWVEIWNVIAHQEDRLVGRYCGSTAPGPIESREQADALKILLHTDDEGVYSGFKARYSFFTPGNVFGDDCGGNISNAISGEITSPQWPAKYEGPSTTKGDGHKTCNWYLAVRPGNRVMLHFQQFSVEGDPNTRGCAAAAVRIWEDVDGIPVELCGQELLQENSQFVSTRNTMRITFIMADKAIGAPGFRAVWTEVQDGSISNCHNSFFRCAKSQFCIPMDLKCDGTRNCGIANVTYDHSDEEDSTCSGGIDIGDMNLLFTIGVGVAIGLFFIIVVCAWGQRRKRRRRRRLQLRRPPIHVCDNAGARFAAMDSV